MKGRGFILLCSLFFRAAVSSAAGPAVALEGEFADIARDGTGTVWAIPKAGGEIASLEGQHWVRRKIIDVAEKGARPVQLINLPNGGIMCLWQDGSDSEKWYRTVHRGKESNPAGIFRSKLHKPRLWPCSDGCTLLTEEGPTVIYFSGDHSQADVGHIPENLFIKPTKTRDSNEPPTYVPIQAVEDGRHDLWLWSPEMLKHDWQMRLGGLVKFMKTGQPFILTRVTNDNPPISSVVCWDEKNLAVAVSGIGLLLFPVEKHALNLMPAPEKDAFRYIEQLFKVGNDWHAVATPQPTTMEVGVMTSVQGMLQITNTTYYNTRQPADVLWKLHDGKWQALQRGLDETPAFGTEHPWVAVAQGLFITSHGNGDPWVFPAAADVSAYRLSAALGFTATGVNRVCQADAAHLVMLDYQGKTWLWPTALRPDPATSPPFERFKTVGQMLRDSRGRIWCVRTDDTFAQWDGRRWSVWPLPADVKKCRGIGFINDGQDRGWILPRFDQSTAILDFKTGQWHAFDSTRQALEAQLPHGVRLDVPEYPFCEHAFSADGCIGGFFGDGEIALFEKGGWRTWKFHDIAGPESHLGGPTFFTASGTFCVPTQEESVWQWRGSAWKLAQDVSVPKPGTSQRRPELEILSHGGIIRFNNESSVQDRFGVIWSLKEKELRKYVPGRDVPVFPPGQLQPFPLGAALARAVADDAGGVFLEHNSAYQDVRQQVYIPPRFPVPQTEISVVENEADTVRLKLANQSGGETFYAWRLDNEDWGPVQEQSELRFQPLPEGGHRFEARAYNAALTPDPKTASVSFRVSFNSSALSTRFISQLTSGELSVREAAARSLANIGPSILPQLKAAREKAETSSGRWWLDAVMQQIERRRSESSQPRRDSKGHE